MGGHISNVCKWVPLATLTLIHCFPSNVSCKYSATACLIKLWGLPVSTKTITWCCPTVPSILIVSAVVSPLRARKEISGSISLSSLYSSSMSCSSSDSFQQSIKKNHWHLWPTSYFSLQLKQRPLALLSLISDGVNCLISSTFCIAFNLDDDSFSWFVFR